MGLPIEGKTIVPVIVTNHSYFTGFGAITEDSDQIFIVDYDLFEQIVSRRKMPCWDYDSEQEAYVRSESELDTYDAMVEALAAPWKYLKNIGPRKIQISETGIGFEIASTPKIDFLPIELRQRLKDSEPCEVLY